jgi:hypothetical protein
MEVMIFDQEGRLRKSLVERARRRFGNKSLQFRAGLVKFCSLSHTPFDESGFRS